jgi:hypothetical protein
VSTPGAGKGRSYYGIPAEDNALAAVPYPLDCGTAYWFTENDSTERLSADVRARPDMPVLKWAHEFAFSSVAGLAANASTLRGSLGERFAQMPEALFKASATRIFAAVRTASDVEKAKDPGFAAVGGDTLAAMAVRRGADAAATPQYHAVRGHHALPDGTIVPFLVEGCLVEMPVSAKEAPSPQFTMNRTIMYGSPVFKGVKWREKVRGDWHSTEGDLNALCALYQVDRRPSPAVVTLHVTCPNPGYSGYGKQQFDTTWLVDAVTEVMERITLQIRKQRAGESRRKNISDGPRDSIRDTLFSVLPKLWERETENGSLPIMIRQMYYATRKVWHTVHRDDLQYGTFCAYVDEYERNIAREEICLRDPRGTLLEPHSGRELRLGTDAVAKFNPKKWEGHTIVFVEKEGFAHLLKAYGVTKRYDAIIIGSKGFAVEACRVVLQKYNRLLGDLVNIIALHDADPAGYMIGYDLATNLPRFGENTKINVVDAGLTITEAKRLGLQDEPFDLKKSVWSMVNNMRSKRVADPDGRTRALIDPDAWDAFMPQMYRGTDYPTWASNPRGRRVELNAMAPRQFVNWLEGVLDANGCRKVRPPDSIVDAQMAKARENKIRNEVGEMLMRRLGNDVVAQLLGKVGVASYDLDGVLAKKPEQHWEYLVTQAAQSGMNLEPLIDQALSSALNK